VRQFGIELPWFDALFIKFRAGFNIKSDDFMHPARCRVARRDCGKKKVR